MWLDLLGKGYIGNHNGASRLLSGHSDSLVIGLDLRNYSRDGKNVGEDLKNQGGRVFKLIWYNIEF